MNFKLVLAFHDDLQNPKSQWVDNSTLEDAVSILQTHLKGRSGIGYVWEDGDRMRFFCQWHPKKDWVIENYYDTQWDIVNRHSGERRTYWASNKEDAWHTFEIFNNVRREDYSITLAK